MTERANQWQVLMREQERSGLTQAAFCRQRKIKPGTFAWWKRRLRAGADATGSARVTASRRTRSTCSERSASAPDSVRFVEVQVAGTAPQRYEIVLPGGRVLRVPGDFDPVHVARLIRAVESAC